MAEKSYIQDRSFLARFREKMKIDLLPPDTKQTILRWTFSTYCKKSQSISDRNSFTDFLSFILIFKKDKMHVRIAHFASLHVFVEWHQNPKWAGKLWSLIVKTLNFDWPAEHVFVTRVDKYLQATLLRIPTVGRLINRSTNEKHSSIEFSSWVNRVTSTWTWARQQLIRRIRNSHHNFTFVTTIWDFASELTWACYANYPAFQYVGIWSLPDVVVNDWQVAQCKKRLPGM